MQIKKQILAMSLAVLMLLSVAITACQSGVTVDTSVDREGNPIVVPETVERIISIGPSNTEILIALGLADKIVAADYYSSNVEGLPSDIPLFVSITEVDGEQLIDLEPDILVVTGMHKVGGNDTLSQVQLMGICVAYIPTSSSIEGIKDDIRFIATVMGVQAKGNQIISDMEKEIKALSDIAKKITDKKSIYFELGDASYPYSVGNNTYLNEMLEIIGAVNIFADQDGWLAPSSESIVEANPDVVFTVAYWMLDPIDDITSRTGWQSITAVKDSQVYFVDPDRSQRPSQLITEAMREMAKLLYPDFYK
ncbi:MAG: ABC transporter substrate-binding protein [Dehalococcoidia bacterium]|nr:ABC transporter substrate-binding protein [Dehalococcoidia bacterium]